MTVTLPFGPLVHAHWIERRKRFMLDVRLDDGSMTTAHCPNTGAMTGVGGEGVPVLLSRSDNPKRRYALTLEAVKSGDVWVGVNTQNPNRVGALLAKEGAPPFDAAGTIRPEVRYGRAERIDLLITPPEGPRTFVEIKNVHLVERPGEASFPDCVTARGAKHLDALAEVVAEGERALMVFLIQRDDVKTFHLARDIDAHYGERFDAAHKAGVQFAALSCKVDETGITPSHLVPILDLPSCDRRAA